MSMLDDFLSDRLDPAAFTHRDHVCVAYEALSRQPTFEAIAQVAQGLRRLAGRANVPDKFHATRTMAFMCLIAERMAQNPAPDAETFLSQNPDLLNATVLSTHYSDEKLGSSIARAVPVLPDRAPG